MIYRYVLHLEPPDGPKRSIRWTFTHPVNENDVIDLPTLGTWQVKRAVSGGTGDAGFLFCEPA